MDDVGRLYGVMPMNSKVSPAVIVAAVAVVLVLAFVLGRMLMGSGDGSTDKEYKINLPSAQERSRNAPDGLGGGG
jgi:hypothetical protein